MAGLGGALGGSDDLDDGGVVRRGEALGLAEEGELLGGGGHGGGEAGWPGGPADDAHVVDEDVQAAEDFGGFLGVGLEDARAPVGEHEGAGGAGFEGGEGFGL